MFPNDGCPNVNMVSKLKTGNLYCLITIKTLTVSLYCKLLIAVVATIDLMSLSAEWSVQPDHICALSTTGVCCLLFMKCAHMHAHVNTETNVLAVTNIKTCQVYWKSHWQTTNTHWHKVITITSPQVTAFPMNCLLNTSVGQGFPIPYV